MFSREYEKYDSLVRDREVAGLSHAIPMVHYNLVDKFIHLSRGVVRRNENILQTADDYANHRLFFFV